MPPAPLGRPWPASTPRRRSWQRSSQGRAPIPPPRRPAAVLQRLRSAPMCRRPIASQLRYRREPPDSTAAHWNAASKRSVAFSRPSPRERSRSSRSGMCAQARVCLRPGPALPRLDRPAPTHEHCAIIARVGSAPSRTGESRPPAGCRARSKRLSLNLARRRLAAPRSISVDPSSPSHCASSSAMHQHRRQPVKPCARSLPFTIGARTPVARCLDLQDVRAVSWTRQRLPVGNLVGAMNAQRRDRKMMFPCS